MIGKWIIGSALLLLAATAANAKQYSARRYDVAIRVLERGTLEVTETVVFQFEDGTFSFVTRDPVTAHRWGRGPVGIDGRPGGVGEIRRARLGRRAALVPGRILGSPRVHRLRRLRRREFLGSRRRGRRGRRLRRGVIRMRNVECGMREQRTFGIPRSPFGAQHHHSTLRSATAGSTRMARRAGMRHARTATPRSTTHTAANVSASVGCTPNSWLCT